MLRLTLVFDEPELVAQPVPGTLTGVYRDVYTCGYCEVVDADDLTLAEHVVGAHVANAEIETVAYTRGS